MERSPGGGLGNPFQYSCLENAVDSRAWWATVHGVAKSQTRLSDRAHRLLVSLDFYQVNKGQGSFLHCISLEFLSFANSSLFPVSCFFFRLFLRHSLSLLPPPQSCSLHILFLALFFSVWSLILEESFSWLCRRLIGTGWYQPLHMLLWTPYVVQPLLTRLGLISCS